MGRQDTRLVSRHDWFQVFLERDSSRCLLVRRGGGGDDWRWYAGAAHSSSAAPLRRAPACCVLCSPALVHQSSLRGRIAGWLLHSRAATVRDVARCICERSVPGVLPSTVWNQHSVEPVCVWFDFRLGLLAMAATLAAHRRSFTLRYSWIALCKLSPHGLTSLQA